MGLRLIGRDYVEISTLANGGIPAATLGLEFHLFDDSFGIYDPEAQEWLKISDEAAIERDEDAEERATREADAQHSAEAAVAHLQAELERLKGRL